MYPIDNLYRGWRRRPDAVAVEDGVRGITYSELVERVEALASALQAKFPAPQARIGICGYNTIEHVIAILAVAVSLFPVVYVVSIVGMLIAAQVRFSREEL